MSRPKYSHSTLSGLIDSDSDDVQFIARESFPTPDSAAENKAPGKKGRQPKVTMPTKVTKAKAPTRRTSDRLTAKSKEAEPVTKKSTKAASGKSNRKVLADKTNQQVASDTEEVDEFEQDEDTAMADELEASVVAVKQVKPKATKKKTDTARGKAAKEIMKARAQVTEEVELEIPQTQVESRTTKKKAPVKRKAAPELSPHNVIQETQVEEMEVDYGDNEEEVAETLPQSAPKVRRPRSQSRPRQPAPPQRRGGSASDTERSDPTLRRKLGDITKKFDNLNMKYQDLREIGLKEAERNFERLKKQSEERTAGK